MKTFRVYYRNGNQKLFEAKNMMMLMSALSRVTEYIEGELVSDIVKVEEVSNS